VLFVYLIAVVILSMHVSAIEICEHIIIVYWKVATFVGLVQYFADQLAVHGPRLLIYLFI
jgi:hypothetical protein